MTRLCLFMLACSAVVSAAAAPPLGIATEATVVGVVDGDTIEIEVRKVIRVRLIDCWCPELDAKNRQEKNRAELARRHMVNLAMNERGTLFIPTEHARHIGQVTSMGRALGHFWVEGSERSLSELMVDSSYATREKPK